MAECEGCGSFVSAEFARVMGDNDGTVHACIECGTNNVGSDAGGVSDNDAGN